MVVLAIAAVLAMFAIPSYESWNDKRAVDQQTRSLVDTLRFARDYAATQARWVCVCRTDTPLADLPSCTSTSTGDWSSGWLVFVDTDGDGQFQTDGTEQILQRQAAFNLGASMTTSNSTYSTNFRPDGLASRSQATFVIAKGNAQNRIVISAQGRITVSSP